MSNKPYNGNPNLKVVALQQTQTFSGPLPHPDILSGYEAIVPGLANRIIKMAENQSEHRQKLESEVISSDKNLAKRGQVLGFIISIFGLGMSAVIAIFVSPAAGVALGFGTIASLVGTFMYGHKAKVEKLNEIKKGEEK